MGLERRWNIRIGRWNHTHHLAYIQRRQLQRDSPGNGQRWCDGYGNAPNQRWRGRRGMARVSRSPELRCLFPLLTEANGRPAIVYFNDVTNEITYLRADDALGTSWDGTTQAIGGDNYGFMKIMKSGDNPAVIYFGENGMMFIRANDSSGTAGCSCIRWAAFRHHLQVRRGNHRRQSRRQLRHLG